jgi:uncharacterized membrane protein YphA (DoxX/SURF4 family)/thiol-disulfide isomerase/thioredoxin
VYVVSLIARIALAGVLVVAGAGKLADRGGARAALEDFGVPWRLAGPLALLLPLAEIGIGLALLPATTAPVAAAGAALLFGTFAIAIAAALRRGDAPDCHCFGAVHSSPVSGATLGRTAGFALAAAAVAAAEWGGSGHGAVGWVGDLSTVEALALAEAVALLGVVAGAVWLSVHLLRQNGRLLVRLDAVERATGVVPAGGGPERPAGLEVGAPAPSFRLSTREGVERGLEDLGERVMLLFADSGCGPCRTLFPTLDEWSQELAPDVHIAVVLSGGTEAASEVPDGIEVLLDQQREVQSHFAVAGTPMAVLVEEERVASEPAPGAGAIRRLIEQTIGKPAVEVHRVG